MPLDESEKGNAVVIVRKLQSVAIISALKHSGFSKYLQLKKASGMGIITILNLKFLKN